MIVGRYTLRAKVSASAMSEVWTATDASLDRLVVVKLLAQTADRRRFEREARAAAPLTHANIVRLFDYGEDRDRPYIVFEYLPGGSLASRLTGDPPTGEEIARVALDVASGLAYAHRQGVVHRDLKPGNILFDAAGCAKIADFGIALVAGADTLTRDGEIVGTPAYMAPEQVRGEAATSATDVYSFGVILYEMLSGRPPFVASDPLEVAAMHRDADVPPLTALRPDVPPPLANLATAALAKDTVGRPADGAALVASIERAIAAGAAGPGAATTRLTDAAAAARPRRARSRALPRPAFAAVAAAALLVGGVVAAFAITRKPNSLPPAPVHRLKPRATVSRAHSNDLSRVSSHTPSRRSATTRRVAPTVAKRAAATTAVAPASSPQTTESVPSPATTGTTAPPPPTTSTAQSTGP